MLFFSHNNLRLDSRLMVAMTIYQQIVSFYRLKTSTAIIFAWDFRWKFSLNYSARVHSITLFQFTWKPVALKICEKRHDTHGTGRLGSPDGTNGVTVAFPFLSSLARLSLCRHIKNPPPFYKEGHARRSSIHFFFCGRAALWSRRASQPIPTNIYVSEIYFCINMARW